MEDLLARGGPTVQDEPVSCIVDPPFLSERGGHPEHAAKRRLVRVGHVVAAVVVGYPTALIMSKIGRYMATIMPPTTTPSTTIMIGSIAARSTSTAASTSSS